VERASAPDLDAVVALLAVEQPQPERNVPLLGNDASAIRADIESLEPAWNEAAFVARDSKGAGIVAVAFAEWSDDPARVWVYGPWVARDDSAWNAQAPALLDAVLGATPDHLTEYELSGDVANVRLARLAAARGLQASEVNLALALDFADAASWMVDPRVRHARADDEPLIAPLHDAEFPNTYASAAQLVAGADDRVVLIADDGAFRGYAAGRVMPDGEGYVDFVGVTPDARGEGLGRALVTSIVAELATRGGRPRVCLTVQEHRAPARALYNSLGFRQDAAIVGYRSARE
jgi:ribosomal protein S18 acetylase RimI-like enzyme